MSTTPQPPSTPGDADAQLDALLSRINALAGADGNAEKQQPRPASMPAEDASPTTGVTTSAPNSAAPQQMAASETPEFRTPKMPRPKELDAALAAQATRDQNQPPAPQPPAPQPRMPAWPQGDGRNGPGPSQPVAPSPAMPMPPSQTNAGQPWPGQPGPGQSGPGQPAAPSTPAVALPPAGQPMAAPMMPQPGAPGHSTPSQPPAAPLSEATHAAPPIATSAAPSSAVAPPPGVPGTPALHQSSHSMPTQYVADGPQALRMPMGFQPSRDEAWRPAEPENLLQGNINESILEAIVYRSLLNIGECQGRDIAENVKVPFRMLEPLLARLKMEQNIAYKSATATNDYVYILTESGRKIARNHNNDCTYAGSCPVVLSDYVKSVRYQTIEGQFPKKDNLLRAFHDLLINPKILNRLGPAVASGRGMFLFGFPGNGKTSIAERVTSAFGKHVWIPRAIDVDGEIMRVFDPMNHELDMPEDSSGLLDEAGYDKRWVRILRPTIIAGGELTLEMLEVMSNRETNISESPLQLKSNCGTLVIDDFGRQKMRVDELLNRWIVPLEKRYDFLNMSSGKKIQVPFDQLVIFSTNLEPKDLVDDAFLRRIPYKIEIENPPEKDFRKLFEIMCRVIKVPYNQDAIDYLIENHYKPINRPFRNCQPRDLLLQVKNFCLYNGLEVELRNDYLDFAVENYFSVM